MKLLQLSSNTALYKVGLIDFLEVQKEIKSKFHDKIKHNTKMEVMDKYLLQILEEIWECKSALDSKEELEEAVDVLMYLGSFYSILTDGIISEELDSNILYPNKSGEDLQTVLVSIQDDLLAVRRLFPERKWHKNEKAVDESIIVASNMIIGCILKLISVLLVMHIYQDKERFDIELLKKQKYILSL